MNKRCRICGKEKDISEFYKQKGGMNGVRGICKECSIKRAKGYYWEHRAKILGRNRVLYDVSNDKYEMEAQIPQDTDTATV